ncbi:MAG: nucleotidyltransferase domain-containing protein [Spirochaetota bacterium]
MMVNYTEEKRRIARDTASSIVDRLDPARILLFGSVARGDARETSDIDLLVVKESDMPFKKRMAFLYAEIERHEDIEMLWYTPQELGNMKQWSSFVRRVLKEAELIYERTQ